MTIKAKKSEIRALLAATFPEYAGRTFKIEPAKTVTFWNLNWSGGTRSQFRACSITGQKGGTMDRYNAAAPWNNPAEGKTIELPAGAVIAEHSEFCGKDCGVTFYINPADLPALLPAS